MSSAGLVNLSSPLVEELTRPFLLFVKIWGITLVYLRLSSCHESANSANNDLLVFFAEQTKSVNVNVSSTLVCLTWIHNTLPSLYVTTTSSNPNPTFACNSTNSISLSSFNMLIICCSPTDHSYQYGSPIPGFVFSE